MKELISLALFLVPYLGKHAWDILKSKLVRQSYRYARLGNSIFRIQNHAGEENV